MSAALDRPPEVRHTWLFMPGTWSASGWFCERGEIAHEAHGTSIVRHLGDRWMIEGTMAIACDPPLRFRNEYRLGAASPGASIVGWESDNPAIGRLVGLFVVVGDTIMSSFRSADGAATGSEHLTWLTPDHYRARGLFLTAGEVVSTWSMDLVRPA